MGGTPPTLRIDGDSAGDLVCDIAAALDIDFGADELRGVVTMGDLHAVVLRHVGGRFPDQRRCSTAMAFYHRLRALDARAAPDTPLPELVQGSARHWLKEMSRRSGLCMPPAHAGW